MKGMIFAYMLRSKIVDSANGKWSIWQRLAELPFEPDGVFDLVYGDFDLCLRATEENNRFWFVEKNAFLLWCEISGYGRHDMDVEEYENVKSALLRNGFEMTLDGVENTPKTSPRRTRKSSARNPLPATARRQG